MVFLLCLDNYNDVNFVVDNNMFVDLEKETVAKLKVFLRMNQGKLSGEKEGFKERVVAIIGEEVMKNQFQIYYSGENPKHKEGN